MIDEVPIQNWRWAHVPGTEVSAKKKSGRRAEESSALPPCLPFSLVREMLPFTRHQPRLFSAPSLLLTLEMVGYSTIDARRMTISAMLGTGNRRE